MHPDNINTLHRDGDHKCQTGRDIMVFLKKGITRYYMYRPYTLMGSGTKIICYTCSTKGYRLPGVGIHFPLHNVTPIYI